MRALGTLLLKRRGRVIMYPRPRGSVGLRVSAQASMTTLARRGSATAAFPPKVSSSALFPAPSTTPSWQSAEGRATTTAAALLAGMDKLFALCLPEHVVTGSISGDVVRPETHSAGVGSQVVGARAVDRRQPSNRGFYLDFCRGLDRGV